MQLSLRTRVLGLAVVSFVVLAGVLSGLWYQQTRANIRSLYVEKARSIVLAAESSREEMAHKWEIGLFSAELLSQWARQGEIDKVMGAIPVVTAWQTSMSKAEAGGYEFRVPKFHPRNPKNEPDPIEAQVLEMFETSDADEHHVVDTDRNAIRYFRPIRLTQECMLCHGDPATSQSLWGNSDGLDPTGARMENWGVGEVHGAFEVVQSLEQADAQLSAAMWKGIGGAALLVLISGGAFYMVVTRGVVRPLNAAIDRMRRGANEVADASGQIASSSQTMANGASTQAASLEQTSASMEEMAAMVRQSADNARNASTRSSAAREAVHESLEAMTRMTEAIEQIKHGADETANIIRTIDEIAFQTNLLSLNAAVEAARAGEAGKSFAVVAEEVRALARRCAEAARTTTQLIQQSQTSADRGVDATAQVSELLNKATQNVASMTTLINEVSCASNEQAKGVEQVNRVIVEMDRSTQAAAATAEESASASEQLSAQSSQLRDIVSALESVLTGQRS